VHTTLHTSAGQRKPELRARQLVLVADPAHRLTAADAREIRRAVAISTMSQPQPGDTVALYLDLAEQFGLSVRAVIVRGGGRP